MRVLQTSSLWWIHSSFPVPIPHSFFKEEYSIFSLILQWLQHFPAPPPDSYCPWMRKLREYWLSCWMEMFLSWKWNALHKIAFHKKKKHSKQFNNCPSAFLPREPLDFIHIFWFFNVFVLRPQIPRWKTILLSLSLFLKHEHLSF